MRKFLLTVAVLALTGSASYAGPFGLFGGCSCGSGHVGPVRKLIQHVKQHRPIATATANTCHAVGNVIEYRPIVSAIRGTSCPNGQCPR